MYEQVEKPKNNRSKEAVTPAVQKKSNGRQGFEFVDNRPEVISQRKIQGENENSFFQPIQKKDNNTGLPDNLKSGIENMSGYSMDDVKVHYNSNKPAQLNAHAYAQGTDIHLSSGQEKHLPHEAWHVVQQKQGRVKPTTQVNGAQINDNIGLENEADVMGGKALQMKSIPNLSNKALQKSSIAIVQRLEAIEVDEKSAQFLKDSQYPEGRVYEWESKFFIYIHSLTKSDDRNLIQVVIYISTPASDEVFQNWQEQVATMWNNNYSVRTDKNEIYPVTVQIARRPNVETKGYDVENVKADKALGERGLFGTESMTKWGENDPQDIAHEVGHMIGNVDEYGDVQKYNYITKSWTPVKKPEEGNIMVKGSDPVRMRHFDMVMNKVLPVIGDGAKLIKNVPEVSQGIGGGLLEGMDSQAHEQRVKLISKYLGDNIDNISGETEKWFQENDWNGNQDKSSEALNLLGI